MSNNNVKVGVFNVLANGVSYCSPLWQSDIVMENQYHIFNALQALTLGKINVKATELKEKCQGSRILIDKIITNKLEELEQLKEQLKEELKTSRDSAKEPQVTNLTEIIKALKTSNLIEHNFIYNIVNAVGPTLSEGQTASDAQQKCYIGLKLLQFIENEYNNIENIEKFTTDKDFLLKNFELDIQPLIRLKEELETFLTDTETFYKGITAATPVSEIQKKSDKYNTILEQSKDNILVKLVKSIKKAYTKPKISTCGKLIKAWLQNYANKTGFGLFGGFMVGGSHLYGDTGATGDTKSWDMYNKEHQATFFQRKLDFIKREINDFFTSSNEKVKILVCPEFDYRHEVIKDITQYTKIKCIESLGKRDVPCVATVRVGPPEPILASCDAYSSQTGKGGNTFSSSDNNFCRVVFYSDNIKHKVYEEHDTQYGEVIKNVKLASGGDTEKETIDVISFDNDSNEHVFDLIALHLNSTTSLDKGKTEKDGKVTDFGKKIKEINALKEVINISKNAKRNVIVAGDFNFPFNPVDDGEEDPMQKDIPEDSNGAKLPFGNTLYGFDTTIDLKEKDKMDNFNDNMKLWKTLKTLLNMSDNDKNAGNVTKSRFTKQMGNDQLWEGKGEERKYNTDFIGYMLPEEEEGAVELKDRPVLEDTITGERGDFLKKENGYVPYLADSEDNDWLSDHALVFKAINLGVKITGGLKPVSSSSALRWARQGNGSWAETAMVGGMKYIRNRRNIKSRGNRRNSKKTRRNRRNRRKSIGKRRKTRRKIKSKRHSRKYKRL